MSLKTSQESFQKAFKTEKKNLTKEFINELEKYLRPRRRNRGNSLLLKSIKNNKPLASFSCRADLCDDLKLEMLKRKIPFVSVTSKNGEHGFVIRMEDRAAANDASKTLLKKLGTRCDVVTGEQLTELDNKMKKGAKGLLAVNGLSYKEMRLLEKLCKKNGFLDYMAQDKMSDGTYRVMVRGEKAVEKNQMAFTLSQLVMMIAGKNKNLNAKRIDNELQVDNLRLNNFGRNVNGFKPIYIVGSGNQFMKIEQNGFSYGYATRNRDDVNFVNKYSSNDSIRGFKAFEESFINRIPDYAATTEMNQVVEHFSRQEGTRDSLGFGLTDSERNNYLGESMLVSSIMTTVIANSQNNEIMNASERWVEKTKYITSEAGRFLSGMINNEVPEGYTELDVLEVKNTVSEFELDLKDYETASEYMRGMIITNEKDSLINVQPEEENIQIPGDLKELNGSLDLQDERGVR